jgi:hypothetical protein
MAAQRLTEEAEHVSLELADAVTSGNASPEAAEAELALTGPVAVIDRTRDRRRDAE